MQFQVIQGKEFKRWLPKIAELRISIFREYPYLYDGTLESEYEYLNSYAQSEESLGIVALDDENIMGALTSIPMNEAYDLMKKPLLEHQRDFGEMFYLGDLVLLQEYRGQKTGTKMEKLFEELIRSKKNFKEIAITQILRPSDDPKKPKDYKSANPFWKRLGYEEASEFIAHPEYKEVDTETEVSHDLVFSFKTLN